MRANAIMMKHHMDKDALTEQPTTYTEQFHLASQSKLKRWGTLSTGHTHRCHMSQPGVVVVPVAQALECSGDAIISAPHCHQFLRWPAAAYVSRATLEILLESGQVTTTDHQ